MKKTPYPLSEVYRLLESGPVVLLTTVFADKTNIMTLSWHTMMEFEPPIVGCIVSENDYSFNFLKTTKECVVNIPTLNLAEKVVGCGNTSGRTIDKFTAFQLTPAAASMVAAPLIEECYANLECKVIDMKMVSQYNFFILEVVNAWIDPAEKQPQTLHHLGNGVFMVAGKIIQLPSKMK
ncbi:flavin reductase family protein [Legionella maioricensis]|uniref:Flavin reductase family protein n=1 Tax=Legionella maioricensis TaxID=2896528 RepID=A0A9X2D2D7_9GAMM|nr:flavin reductase family protein [Legionella maioricensis]MCL9684963.1 flavin reductase family protein [Legionella maioricensis]MCL9688205.1 flavin reductase family protein [Legionella maioricensis]